jgi:hypothetical protein
MAFVGQSYSVSQVLTAAQMTAIDTNIDIIRNTHIGTSAPAELTAGVQWIDNTATPWLKKIYDGTDWITVGKINATDNNFEPVGITGTFSPEIMDNSFTQEGSFSVRDGNYLVIGGLCFVWGRIVMTSVGTLSTGQPAHLSPLPFTAKASGTRGHITFLGSGFDMVAAGYSVTAQVPGSVAYANLYTWDAATPSQTLISEIDFTTTEINFSGFYEIA